MKTLRLRDENNKPYTVVRLGVFRKKFYLIHPDFGLILLPKVKPQETK